MSTLLIAERISVKQIIVQYTATGLFVCMYVRGNLKIVNLKRGNRDPEKVTKQGEAVCI